MSFENLETALTVLRNYEGKFFLGKVVNATDPEKLDRVQVHIEQLYNELTGPDNLPWCAPIKFSPMGQGDGYGMFGIPPVDSDVLVIFQEGNPHYPFYWSIQTKGSPLPPGTWGWKDTFKNVFVVGPDGIDLKTDCGFNLNISADCAVKIFVPKSFDLTTGCGAQIKIDESCKMTLIAPGGLDITTPQMNVTTTQMNFTGISNFVGAVNIAGAVTTAGLLTNNGTNVGSGHNHRVLSKDFGVTSPPL